MRTVLFAIIAGAGAFITDRDAYKKSVAADPKATFDTPLCIGRVVRAAAWGAAAGMGLDVAAAYGIPIA